MPKKREYDRGKLDQILADQFGVVARGQAISCGLSNSAIDHRLRPDGPWHGLLPGVYVTTSGAVSSFQRAMAALLHAGPGSVITGATAVRLHNLECAGLNEIDVLVAPKVRVGSTEFVDVTRTTRMPPQIYKLRGLRYTMPARAVADAARGMTRLSDVRAVVATAVQKRGCTLEELVLELRDGPSTGSRWLRIALREIGDGIRSAAEADLKLLIDRSELEKPQYNVALYAADGTFLGVADAWWQRAGVAGEVDSIQYHMSPEDYKRTTMRRNRMQAYGINVQSFLPASIKSDGDTIIKNLRDAIKMGSSKPPLAIRAVPRGERLSDDMRLDRGDAASTPVPNE
jgi:hypothetical protein